MQDVAVLIAALDDETLVDVVRNLGGHDLAALTTAFGQIDDSRPTIVIAYTITGYDLPTQGHPQNVGVWSATECRDWFADDAETIMHWREMPTGQHMELGIAETNLVGLIGELGATWSRWGETLFPIGVLYDPFVERALEPWSYGIYAGGQSILVGTPSGVTLAAEGGAHQSIKTPSIGLEQPGCVAYERAFAIDVEWTLLASMGRLGRPDFRLPAALDASGGPVVGGADRPGGP